MINYENFIIARFTISDHYGQFYQPLPKFDFRLRDCHYNTNDLLGYCG